MIQTSSSPLVDETLPDRLAARGVRMIAPLRSGLGNTTRLSPSLAPSDWARYHAEVLDRLGLETVGLGGHRCGGIYAMDLAAHLGARCARLLLVDTGAPLAGLGAFLRMPAAPKRLFLAARFFPTALRTPFKIVSADFFGSTEGELRAVEYFYDGSPADQPLMTSDRLWRITRDNIDYCLQNPMQCAQDVVHWSRDSSGLLDLLCQQMPVHFLHGAEHRIYTSAAVEALVARHPKASCEIVPGRAQLMIYVDPDRYADALDWAAL